MAAARAFAAEGARVALIARRAEILEDLVAELGDRALALPTDIVGARTWSPTQSLEPGRPGTVSTMS